MDILDVSLVFSVLSCSLVAGFILTYAIVVMPGLSGLDDRAFMRAFQLADGVIQNNQPVFMLIWLGSIISVSAAILSSMVIAGLSEAWVVVLVGAVYLVGVQGITDLAPIRDFAQFHMGHAGVAPEDGCARIGHGGCLKANRPGQCVWH